MSNEFWVVKYPNGQYVGIDRGLFKDTPFPIGLYKSGSYDSIYLFESKENAERAVLGKPIDSYLDGFIGSKKTIKVIMPQGKFRFLKVSFILDSPTPTSFLLQYMDEEEVRYVGIDARSGGWDYRTSLGDGAAFFDNQEGAMEYARAVSKESKLKIIPFHFEFLEEK